MADKGQLCAEVSVNMETGHAKRLCRAGGPQRPWERVAHNAMGRITMAELWLEIIIELSGMLND